MVKLKYKKYRLFSSFLKLFIYCITFFKYLLKNNAIKYKTFKASTIIESIVAMTLIMIGFGIALLVFLNINKSDNSFQKFKAQLILKELSEKVRVDKNPLNDQQQIDLFNVIQTVSDYPGFKDIKLIKIEAYSIDGKKIAERNELILSEYDE